jgi:hypothetical protein
MLPLRPQAVPLRGLPIPIPIQIHLGKDVRLKKGGIKYKFTAEEDEKLKMLVLTHGTNSWSFISHLMGTRNHRQCRERWKNYLNPTLRNDPWTLDEDQILVEKYALFGPKWNKLATFFANRSDNSVRNRWQLILRQWERQKRSGSDPPEEQEEINAAEQE